jgi:hypothetical protein
VIALRKPHSKRDWFALVAGAVFLWFSGMALVMGLQSYLWTKAPGVITYSKPYETRRTYQIELRYTYKYQNQEYTGARYRYRFWMNRDRSVDVDSTQARYKVGEPVSVAVNPSEPSESVLEPGVEFQSFMWPLFGVILILGGLVDPRRQTAVPDAPRPTHRHGLANFLLFAGLALLLYGSNTLYTAYSSLSWPTADGKVLTSQARSAGNTHRNLLWYEYQVQGVRHLSENYHTGGNSTPFKDKAIEVAKRYPVGRLVKVFYNPSDPSESVLEPGPWYGNFVFPAISLVILLISWVARKFSDLSASQNRDR